MSVPAPLAGAAGEKRGRIAVERQRGDVAQVADREADVGELAAIHRARAFIVARAAATRKGQAAAR